MSAPPILVTVFQTKLNSSQGTYLEYSKSAYKQRWGISESQDKGFLLRLKPEESLGISLGSDHKSKECFNLSHVLEYTYHGTVDSYDVPAARLLTIRHISTCPQ